MSDLIKSQKKKRDEVRSLYEKIIMEAPSPVESDTKSLVFIWMYFFVQGEIDRKTLTKNLTDIDINPLDVSYYVEELENQKDFLKKQSLPIKYVPEENK